MILEEVTYIAKINNKTAQKNIEDLNKSFEKLVGNVIVADKLVQDFGNNGKEARNIFKEMAKYSSDIKKNMQGIKVPKMGGRGFGGGKGGGGFGKSPQQDDFSKSFMSGLVQSNVLESPKHFLGRLVSQAVQKFTQFSIRKLDETGSMFQDIVEARAVTKTMISNKAIEEGVDPRMAIKTAEANADKFAKDSIFSTRQALIAQGALAEGGATLAQASSEKRIATLLDATIAKYNKIDVSEGQIQKLSGMYSRAIQSGKFGTLKSQIQGFGGKEFLDAFEKANVKDRFDMLFDLLEKNIGGLADNVRRENQTLAKSIIERNRAEEIAKNDLGELGLSIKTVTESIENNMTPAVKVVGEGLLSMLSYINKLTKPDEAKIDRASKLVNLNPTEQKELGSMKTIEEQKQYVAEKLWNRNAGIAKKLSEKDVLDIQGTEQLSQDERKAKIAELNKVRRNAQAIINAKEFSDEFGYDLTPEQQKEYVTANLVKDRAEQKIGQMERQSTSKGIDYVGTKDIKSELPSANKNMEDVVQQALVSQGLVKDNIDTNKSLIDALNNLGTIIKSMQPENQRGRSGGSGVPYSMGSFGTSN